MKRLPPGTVLNLSLKVRVNKDNGDAAFVEILDGGSIGLAGIFSWFTKHDICHAACVTEGLRGGLLPQKCRVDPTVEIFAGGDVVTEGLAPGTV